MKKVFFISFGCLATLVCVSQQRPHYTQYVLNNYILNPALSGIENYTDLKLGARDQWIGFEGRPQTFYLSVHAPIGKRDYKTSATSYSVPGQNPRGTSYWENYRASDPHHGVGLSIVNDITGNYNVFTADVSYAYHLGLSPTINLAAGFSGGFSKVNYNRSKSSQPNDPGIASNGNIIYKTRPDLNAGLWLYSGNYFIGLSAQQVIPQKVAFVNDTLGLKLTPHLFGTAGYRFLVNEDVNAIPSVMVKSVAGAPSQVDLNVKLQYQDLFWVGGGIRFGSGYSAMLGLNANNTFNVSYAYDFTTSAINVVSRGTHEIVIGFLLGNRYDDSCPRNVW
ncbi:MAG: type IX secretion system membrane protein PorP/SprF [Bacteroidota bacterium]|nr:type IX secretion system membrane protein PorP/SprF [Bacteroidota bacterium]